MAIDTLYLGGPWDGRRVFERYDAPPYKEVADMPSMASAYCGPDDPNAVPMSVKIQTFGYRRVQLTDNYQAMVHCPESTPDANLISKLLFDSYKATDL